MKCILELIDLLGKLGYNELQLYIEHTFAFKDHLTVWGKLISLNAQRDPIDRLSL